MIKTTALVPSSGSVVGGMANHSSTLAWRFPHGQRGLVGCHLKGCKALDTAQNVVVLFTQSCLTPSPRGSSVLGILLARTLQSESESWSVISHSLWPHGLYGPWNSAGQNTGVRSHSLLQGIFPTQEPNMGLLHCRRILYQLSYQGSPGKLEWVAISSSRGSSRPGIETASFVSPALAGGFFTTTTWEILLSPIVKWIFC